MATPRKTLWKLDPHSQGKHLVLENYLNAWLPIISSWNQRILFIDGFSGPGIYEHGESGSPLIAINTFKDHENLKRSEFEIVFYFIEKDSKRKNYLSSLIDDMKPDLPGRFNIHTVEGEFNESMVAVLDDIDKQNKQLAPCLAMIDPFGVKDTPMSIIKRILNNRNSEVYISFMYEWINRFKEHDNFEGYLDELYGCKEWRQAIEIKSALDRKKYFFDLYKTQLRKAGATYVVHFELYEGKRLVYAIFFGTKSLTGCDKMKQAIWKVAPFGDFAFYGVNEEQFSLDLTSANFKPLIEQLSKEFKNKGWVFIKDVLNFVKSDKTGFHSSHVKTKALREMEKQGLIQINENTRKRKGSFPDGTQLRFN